MWYYGLGLGLGLSVVDDMFWVVCSYSWEMIFL